MVCDKLFILVGIAELWHFSTYTKGIFAKINAFVLTVLSFLIPGILGIMVRYPNDYGKHKIFLIFDIGLILGSLFLLTLFLAFWTVH